MIGIRWYVIWFTWWIRSLVIFLLLSLVIASFVKIVLQPNSSNNFLFADKAILKNTDFFMFLAFLLCYSLQCSTFILFISQFFSKSKIFSKKPLKLGSIAVLFVQLKPPFVRTFPWE